MQAIDDYITLITSFASNKISANEFIEKFLRMLKNERRPISDDDFLIVDKLFGDADSCTDDPELLASMDGFYINNEQLKQRAKDALIELQSNRQIASHRTHQ